MCGIAGIVTNGSRGLLPTDAELRSMIAELAHRGPDGSTTRIDGRVGFAHARLSIIDIEGGTQPIHNERRTVWVVFNGEIFNYLELRKDLERQGHRFYTESDTEVIVHLYEEHGDRFVDYLNGQFAIAVHDLDRRRLLLVRDRVGIRPLFYVKTDDRLVFASEIKALFALPGVRREIAAQSLGETFSLWTVTAPATSFTGVFQLAPGTMMTIDLDRDRIEPRTSSYWQWDFPLEPLPPRSEDDLAEELRSLLVDAVRLQLRADVPVGAYLSGGLDSSAIVAMISRHANNRLRTFSMTFDDPEFDEQSFQDEVAQHFGTEHTRLKITRDDIASELARTVWHVEAPIVRSAATPLLLLSRHVREAGFKVVLTGEGADEVFAGYDLFKEAAVRRFIARGSPGGPRARLLQRLYPYLANSPVRGRMAEQYFVGQPEQPSSLMFAHDSRIRTSRRALMYLRPHVREQLGGYETPGGLVDRLPSGFDRWHPLQRDQYVEAVTLMSGYLLSAQGDRVSMANSIEGRVPFLDHRVIEFANRLPPRMKLRTLKEKFLLKRAMLGYLPERIVRRTKQPYRAPDVAAFFRAGKPLPWVADILSADNLSRSPLFEPGPVAALLRKCAAGRAIGFGDNIAFMGILSTTLLHEQFVRRSAPVDGLAA